MAQVHTLSYEDFRGQDVEIDYTVSKFYPARVGGPPEDCEPASGGEVEIVEVRDADGTPIELLPDDVRRLTAYIEERIDCDQPDAFGGRDPDEAYDRRRDEY